MSQGPELQTWANTIPIRETPEAREGGGTRQREGPPLAHTQAEGSVVVLSSPLVHSIGMWNQNYFDIRSRREARGSLQKGTLLIHSASIAQQGMRAKGRDGPLEKTQTAVPF